MKRSPRSLRGSALLELQGVKGELGFDRLQDVNPLIITVDIGAADVESFERGLEAAKEFVQTSCAGG